MVGFFFQGKRTDTHYQSNQQLDSKHDWVRLKYDFDLLSYFD